MEQYQITVACTLTALISVPGQTNSLTLDRLFLYFVHAFARPSIPMEARQSQHSCGTGSPCVSGLQQDMQRPSPDSSWRLGHTVQFHWPGPRQSRQLGSHGWQLRFRWADSFEKKAG